jgi:hypothetical protein
MLQSLMQELERRERPESPSVRMMDLDVDEDSEGREEAGCRCLILCCAECLSVVLADYSNGTILGHL